MPDLSDASPEKEQHVSASSTWPLVTRPPRLFVLDVDGTLLTSDHRVTDRSRAAVAACRAAGVEVMLASSRPPGALAHVLRALDLHHSAAFVACQGGVLATLDQHGHRSIVADAPLRLRTAHRVAAAAADQGLTVNWFTTDDWYVSRWDRAVEIEASVVGMTPAIREIHAVDEPPHKLMFMGPDLAALTRLLEQDDEIEATVSNPTYLEVTRRGVSKASAIRLHCENEGIPLAAVVAIGDGPNDLELFDAVGTSVAPANAHPSVLARADLRTRSNDDDGVAAAIAYLAGLSLDPPL